MVFKTLVHYKDPDGNECVKSTIKFNSKSTYEDIIEWISTWLWGSFTYDLKITDTSINEDVDFDEDFMKEQNPYQDQSVTSVIRLHILQTSSKAYFVSVSHSF